jgi:hypothetical protein
MKMRSLKACFELQQRYFIRGVFTSVRRPPRMKMWNLKASFEIPARTIFSREGVRQNLRHSNEAENSTDPHHLGLPSSIWGRVGEGAIFRGGR